MLDTQQLIDQFAADVKHWDRIIARDRQQPSRYSATDQPRWQYCRQVCEQTRQKLQLLRDLEQVL